MEIRDLADKLRDIFGNEYVSEQEMMSKHTSFRVGGPADIFVNVNGADTFAEGLKTVKEAGANITVLGNGSNVLVSDKGIRGVVFAFGQAFSDIVIDTDIDIEDADDGINVDIINGDLDKTISEINAKNTKSAGNAKAENKSADKDTEITVTVCAGALMGNVGNRLKKESITGFEWAAGIPGTIGGGVYMNAGAYGGEMKQILKSVKVLTKDLRIVDRDAESLDLGYRRSALMDDEAYVLTATFGLKRGNREEIEETMKDLAFRRKDKQPLEYPSAGSTFKRPVGYFAGKLIEDAGLRGFKVGGAQVSEKHCGFVINAGGATAKDIYDLTEEVKRIVNEQFGVTLEREIRLLGEF